MHNARRKFVRAKALDGVLKIDIVQALVRIGPCRNGTLLRIESILPGPRTSHRQPSFRLLRMRRTHGQTKAVAQPHKHAAIARRRSVAVVSARCRPFAHHVTMCPVAHNHHGRFAFQQHIGTTRPADRRPVIIGVRQHARHRVDAGVQPRIRPQCCVAANQLHVVILAVNAQQHTLKEMRCLKLVRATNCQRNNAGRLQLVSHSKKLSKCRRRNNVVIAKYLDVVPKHIRTVNVHRHRINLAVIGDLIKQQLRHVLVKPLLLKEVRQRLHLAGINILGQLFASMHLPSVRRLAALQARLQNGLGICACATGDCCINNLRIRILSREDLEHFIQAICFAAIRPPTEDLHLLSLGDSYGSSRRCCRFHRSRSGWRCASAQQHSSHHQPIHKSRCLHFLLLRFTVPAPN